MKKIILFLIIFVSFSSTSFAASNYIWSSEAYLSVLTSASINETYTDNSSNPLKLDCGSCILIEQNSGQVLYSYNCHEQLRPASVTKLMSILLIMDALKDGKITYTTPIPCSENASKMGGSQIWLDTTETLTVEEMLKAICVVSANDCVVAMAEYLGGTEEGFVQMMNEKAVSLGMKDTTFKNCHGIDEDGHVTSSYDISLMSKELLTRYPEITKYTTIWNDSLRSGKSELINTNKLVHNYNGCTGLKTGSTSQALYNLSASATRDGLSLIAVVMKAPTSAIRFNNAKALLDYGFSNYEYKSLTKSNDVIKSINISKGIPSSINAISQSACGTVLPKGNSVNIDQNVSINENLSAPISKGEVVGKISFTLNGNTVAESNLISESDVSKFGYWSTSGSLFNKWFNLLR